MIRVLPPVVAEEDTTPTYEVYQVRLSQHVTDFILSDVL